MAYCLLYNLTAIKVQKCHLRLIAPLSRCKFLAIDSGGHGLKLNCVLEIVIALTSDITGICKTVHKCYIRVLFDSWTMSR